MANDQQESIQGKQNFRNLLLFLLLYLFGSPFLVGIPSLAVIVHLSFSITLLFSVYAVQKRQNYRTFAMVLLLPVLILYWLSFYDLIPLGPVWSYCLLTIYLGLLVFSYAQQIMREERVTMEVLFATLCLYLIIGLFWGALYALHYHLSPMAYAGILLETTKGAYLTMFNYFSIVTLTTLGYGDITPQTPIASAFCQMEAIVGQFFTAVVIAWLVSNFVSAKNKQEK